MIPVLNIIHLPKELFPTNTDFYLESLRREHHIKGEAFENKFTYGLWDGIIDKELPWRGISRAHKAIVQHAKDNGLDKCFIAEDDVKIFPGGWLRFIETMPEQFDIYFGGVSGGEISGVSSEPISEAGNVSGSSGMFLYCIHSLFYDTFLSAPEELNIDRWLSGLGLEQIEKMLGRKPVYKVCYPMAAITRDGVSFKSGEYVQHDRYWKAYKVL